MGSSPSSLEPMDSSTPCSASLSRCALCRHASKVRAVCVNALVRICAGGVEQSASLPRQLDAVSFEAPHIPVSRFLGHLNFIACLIALPYNDAKMISLEIVQRLGSYEITALLGKGGMGEVYRARDTKLKREVAIKILPDEFSRDPERVSRFQREAEALAALNHQN